MNQEEKFQTEYDEIDLMDYVKVIIKRKWLILIIFLGSAIVAGVYSFSLPKVYKIDTTLEIGKVGSDVLEEPVQLVEKLKAGSYKILAMEELNIQEKDYPKVEVVNPQNTNLVIRKIESAIPQKAKLILEKVNELILEEHQEKVKVKKELIDKNIKTTEEQIKLVESDIEKTKNKLKPIDSDIERIENKIVFAGEEKKNLEAKIETLQKVLLYQQDPGTQFALFDTKEKLANKKQEIEDLYLEINSLQRTKEDIEVQINSLRTSIESLNAQINALRASLDDIKLTKIVKSPTISENPIAPRKKLNIAIAGVLGLFVGVFWAFGKEWWEKSNMRKA